MKKAQQAGAILFGFVAAQLSCSPSSEDALRKFLRTQERRYEGRLSLPEAAPYRPYNVSLSRTSPPPGPLPFDLLSRVSSQPDSTCRVAAIYFAAGRPEEAERQLRAVDDPSPAILSDLAAVQLALGKHEPALEYAGEALFADPDLRPAQWNAAVARQRLGLKRSAQRAFLSLAGTDQKGWAQAARNRAGEIERQLRVAEETREAAQKHFGDVVSKRAPLDEKIFSEFPRVARDAFYRSAVTATTTAMLKALEPLAQLLDREESTEVFQGWLKRIRTKLGPFRTKWAAEAMKRRARSGSFDAETFSSGISEVLERGHILLAMDLAWHADLERQHADSILKELPATGDLFKLGHARIWMGRDLYRRGRFEEARETFRGAAQASSSLPAVKAEALARMSDVLPELGELAESVRLLSKAHQLAKQADDPNLLIRTTLKKGDLLFQTYRPEVAKAFLEEAFLDADQPCTIRKYAAIRLAHVHVKQMRPNAGLETLLQVRGCPSQWTPLGAMALVDTVRGSGGWPQYGEWVEKVLREAKGLSNPRHRLLAGYVRGRAALERDATKGFRILQDFIRASEAQAAEDASVRAYRGHAFALLALHYVRTDRPQEAANILARERGYSVPPSGCLVAALLDDERRVVVARGGDSRIRSLLDENWSVPEYQIKADAIVPEELKRHLQGCGEVGVFALPPLFGLPELLPPHMPWGYRLRGRNRGPTRAGESRLILANPTLASNWPPLPSYQVRNPSTAEYLSGRRATRAKFLERLPDAGRVEVFTHGRASEMGRLTELVLAEDVSGASSLRPRDLEGLLLVHAPLVFLGACYGGEASPSPKRPRNLPHAFVDAGARAVVASSSPIPSVGWMTLVRRVQEAMDSGLTIEEAVAHYRGAEAADEWAKAAVVFKP